jgi:hypothetical protein
MVTTIVTEGGLEAWTAAARRAQATTDDMVYLTTFNVQITGSQHSDMFVSDRSFAPSLGRFGFRADNRVVVRIGFGATGDDHVSSCRAGVCSFLGVLHVRRDNR